MKGRGKRHLSREEHLLKQQTHDNLVRRLLHNPQYLDMHTNQIISSCVDKGLHLWGKLYVMPDIYIETFDTHFYFEVKSSNHPKTIRHGWDQFRKIEEWIEHYGKLQTTVVGLIYPKYNRPENLGELIIKTNEW